MGRTFQFECPQCHYRAVVSGGADRGVHCAVQTILCRDCHQLFDVLTRIRQGADHVEASPAQTKSARTRLPDGVVIPPLRLIENSWNDFSPGPRPAVALRPQVWTEVKPACPAADFHRIEFWNEPGRCPRCGNYLEKNSALPRRLWD